MHTTFSNMISEWIKEDWKGEYYAKILRKLKEKVKNEIHLEKTKGRKANYLKIIETLEKDLKNKDLSNEEKQKKFSEHLKNDEFLDFAIALEVQLTDTKDDVDVEVKSSELINALSKANRKEVMKYTIDSVWKGFPEDDRKREIKHHDAYRKIDKKMEKATKSVVNSSDLITRTGPIRYLTTKLTDEVYTKEQDEPLCLTYILDVKNWHPETIHFATIDDITKELNIKEADVAEDKVFLKIPGKTFDITQNMRQVSKRVYKNLLKSRIEGKKEDKSNVKSNK